MKGSRPEQAALTRGTNMTKTEATRAVIESMLDATVEALLSRIEEGDIAPRKHRIDGPLIVRGSARKTEGYTP